MLPYKTIIRNLKKKYMFSADFSANVRIHLLPCCNSIGKTKSLRHLEQNITQLDMLKLLQKRVLLIKYNMEMSKTDFGEINRMR